MRGRVAVADAFAMPHPRRVSRAEAERELTPLVLSFMNESRRLDNTRLKRELNLRLTYPDVFRGLAAIHPIHHPQTRKDT